MALLLLLKVARSVFERSVFVCCCCCCCCAVDRNKLDKKKKKKYILLVGGGVRVGWLRTVVTDPPLSRRIILAMTIELGKVR